MKIRFLKPIAICGVGAIIAFGGITVFAAGGQKVQSNEFGSRMMQRGEPGSFGSNESGDIRIGGARRGFGFDSAVESGAISQETADKIAAYLESQVEKIKSISREEAKEQFGENKERKNMFDELVTAGIITQAEVDALKSAMPENGLGFEGGVKFRSFGFGEFTTDMLVENGVIDSQTAANVEAFIQEKAEMMKAEMESKFEEMRAEMKSKSEEMKLQMDELRNMTPEERKQYFEDNKPNRPEGMMKLEAPVDVITEMVNEGILTQSQADAIKELLSQKKPTRNLSETANEI